MNFSSLLSGAIDFDKDEEYLAFRVRLLNAVMLTACLFSLVFAVVDALEFNHLGLPQLTATYLYGGAAALLFITLRGHKERFRLVSVAFVSASFLVFTSALLFVGNDELRIIWYYINIVLVYNLLGTRAGIVVTVLTIVCVLAANGVLAEPLSRNALTTALVSLAATSVIGYAYTSRAVSYFERMTETNLQLQRVASHDFLTGVLNARAYYEAGNRLIRLSERNGTPFSVLFVDLDHFKAINDQYGHESGDCVLQQVACCLAHHMRASDLLGRIGGEEFSCFLPETDLAGAMHLAEKLREAVAELRIAHGAGSAIRMTTSIGVAASRQGDESVAEIQKRADRAMYQAKAQGRNRVMAVEALHAV